MVDSIRQEAMLAIENASAVRDQIRRTFEILDETRSSNSAFYRFMDDRADFIQQLNRIEDLLEESRTLIDRHIEDIESSVA